MACQEHNQPGVDPLSDVEQYAIAEVSSERSGEYHQQRKSLHIHHDPSIRVYIYTQCTKYRRPPVHLSFFQVLTFSDMSALVPAPTKRIKRLVDLPQEVLSHIAFYLNDRTAVSLSTTARPLRLPAESRIWHNLSITPSDLVPPSPTLVHFPPPTTHPTVLSSNLDPAALVPESQLPTAINGTTHIYPHLQNSGHTSALLLGQAIRRLSTHLDAAPWRGGMVRSLILPLRHTVPSELIYLFHRLPGLHHLHISLPHTSMAIPNMPTFIPLDDIFASLHGMFQSLRSVKLAVQIRPGKLISNLLKSAPGLEHLHIFNRTPLRESNQESVGGICATRLKSLMLDSPSTIIQLAAEIVSHSPGLESVGVMDQTFGWQPIPHDPLLFRLAELKSLRMLGLPCTAVPFLEQGFEQVKHLNIIWDAETLRDPDAKVSHGPCRVIQILARSNTDS